MRGNTISLKLQRGMVARTGNLFQYDYGQNLVLLGVDLPVSYEVHFSNEEHGNSKTSIGNSEGVVIPDEFLLSGEPIHVWLFLHDGEDDGETEYHGVIGVTKRAKPTDIQPTPVQQDVITQTISALNDAVSAIPGTIDTALAEAKASGEFDGRDGQDGADGHSPVVTANKVGKVTTVSVDGDPIATINDGTDGQDGYTPVKGVDYFDGQDGKDGKDGVDGVSPTATVTKAGKIATITITDKNGTTTEQISDGSDGDPTTLIDDTAGVGDTGKAWSADKSATENGALKSAIDALELSDNLLFSEMPGTSTTVTMDSHGNPTSIVHTANSETVRTDAFVWGTGTVTETRTLANGKYITITTNLTTLAQTISAVQEVA